MDDQPAVWGLDAMIMLAAVSLVGVATVMSVSGMVVLFPKLAQPFPGAGVISYK
jgi:hypothetical protein